MSPSALDEQLHYTVVDEIFNPFPRPGAELANSCMLKGLLDSGLIKTP